MKVEIRANGSVRFILTPETAIEKLAAQEIAEGAAKGQRVTLVRDENDNLTLSLEN